MRSVQYIPRATEKAYVAQTKDQYIFFVPKSASKQEIAKKIAEEFKVTVISVRTATRKGKATRFSRGKHAYPGTTYRADQKVAFITVKAGDKIPVFESEMGREKKDANSSSEAKHRLSGRAKRTEEVKETPKADKKAEDKAEKKVAKKATKKVASKKSEKKEDK